MLVVLSLQLSCKQFAIHCKEGRTLGVLSKRTNGMRLCLVAVVVVSCDTSVVVVATIIDNLKLSLYSLVYRVEAEGAVVSWWDPRDGLGHRGRCH